MGLIHKVSRLEHVVRVVVVDDHNLVRAGLVAILARWKNLSVVGDARTGEEALRLVSDLKPDLVILDIVMPGMTGYQLIRQLRERHRAVRLLALSMHDSPEHVGAAINLGAHGYVLKDAEVCELNLAIQAVMAGGLWLPATVSRALVDAYVEHAKECAGLSARQDMVLRMIVAGQRTKEIAYELGISVKTVETYRAQVMSRLGVEDVPSLVRYAIRKGIASL